MGVDCFWCWNRYWLCICRLFSFLWLFIVCNFTQEHRDFLFCISGLLVSSALRPWLCVGILMDRFFGSFSFFAFFGKQYWKLNKWWWSLEVANMIVLRFSNKGYQISKWCQRSSKQVLLIVLSMSTLLDPLP